MARLSIGLLIILFAPVHFAVSPVRVRADSRDAVSPFLVRAQLTKWPTPTPNPPPRVEYDDAGHIVSLRLDGMQLAPGDVEIIRSFRQLERLSLNCTSISDPELAILAKLPHLQGLGLNYTAIGDDGVASLAKFAKLKTVCMFRIQATPEAVRALKNERRKLAIGYAPPGR